MKETIFKKEMLHWGGGGSNAVTASIFKQVRESVTKQMVLFSLWLKFTTNNVI